MSLHELPCRRRAGRSTSRLLSRRLCLRGSVGECIGQEHIGTASPNPKFSLRLDAFVPQNAKAMALAKSLGATFMSRSTGTAISFPDHPVISANAQAAMSRTPP